MLVFHLLRKTCFFFLAISTISVLHGIDLTFVRGQSEENNKQIEQSFVLSMPVRTISFHADVPFDESEFTYLVGVKRGDSVSPAKIKEGIRYLFAKNRFKTITVHKTIDEGELCLHYDLVSDWIVSGIKFHGVIIGKDRYKRYCKVDIGSVFDEEQHERSIEAIAASLHQDGYFDATVSSNIVRDTKRKTIMVHIYLSRGHRYKVGSVSADVLDVGVSLTGQEKDYIAQRLYGYFSPSSSYIKSDFGKKIEQFKKELVHKGFLGVEVRLREHVVKNKQNVDLNFTIEVVRKRNIIFWGNRFFSEQQLFEIILLFGNSFWLIPVSMLSEEIERMYHEKGFWEVAVDCKEEKNKDFFVIKEGKRAKIISVECHGMYALDEKWLRRRCFNRLLRKKFFDQRRLNDALEALKKEYKNNGFLDMKLVSQSVVARDKKNAAYSLSIVIDEGDCVLINNIFVPRFPDVETVLFFEQQKEKPLTDKTITKQKEWIESFLLKKGYKEFSIQVHVDRSGASADVTWNVSIRGKKELVGKTVLVGASPLLFSTIKKQLYYKDGDVVDEGKLALSVDRFRSMNIFEGVHAHTQSSGDEKQDIMLSLIHDDPFEVRLRAGAGLQNVSRRHPLGTAATYKIGSSFFVKNPTNQGDSFLVDVDFARSYKNVSFQYDCPSFFQLPFRVRSKAYISRYEQPGFVGSKKDLYQVSQHGFFIGMQEKYALFEVSNNIGFEWMKTEVKRGLESSEQRVADAISFEPLWLGKKIPYFFIEPVLLIDRLDNKVDPRSGNFFLATVKAMLPLDKETSHACFVKAMAEDSFYHAIGPLVMACRFRVGMILYQDFTRIMPTERFYLGGANSIRSYETDHCPPLGCFVDEDNRAHCVPKGGKTMLNGNIELRFPLFAHIGGVLFQDIGTLLASSFNVVEQIDLLAATGFGLRYNTPIGPLRFDIGWKWKVSDPLDYRYAWFLTLGHAF